MLKLLSLALPVVSAVKLVTFDGVAGTTFEFTELNDPVMGGESVGTWGVNTTGQFGIFDGTVNDVPSLKAPGFIKTAASGTFADVSQDFGGALILTVRSATSTYEGFRVTFASGTTSGAYSCAGGGSLPFSRGCFKSKFSVPFGTEFAAIRVPFNTFSDMWSPATGEQTKTCAFDKSVCPTAKNLASISRIEVWAEGAGGEVHLEIQSIETAPTMMQLLSAPELVAMQGSSTVGARPPTEFDTCKGPVQPNLRFGISGRTQPTVPVSVDPFESLAEAVCCDSRVLPFAEPRFLFQAPDIALYSKMDATGVTTFYDSVCGLPLFRAPVNRTFAEFQADTDEHGWPSFRPAEVVTANVVTGKEYVTSTCGTHLGSYLPDENGPRWCMDLSCVAGNPPSIEGALF